MILEAGLADAYGAGFEFADANDILVYNTLKEYRKHPRYASIYGTYTDDTQMAIAITELILETKEWSKLSIADKFVEVFKRDPRKGYSSRFYTILEQVSSGKELLEVLHPNSNRNGAAMRSYPIGIYKREDVILEKSEQQAIITHNTKEGILSSKIIALAAHYFLYKKGSKKHLIEYLEVTLSQHFDFIRTSTLKMEALPTVNTVIALILDHKSMSSCLIEAVDLGGDTDTVASLSLAILSLCKDTIYDLPNWLYKDFKNDTFGKDYLIELDNKLSNKLIE
ncbi:ADP-ribosylglycohydrolase family protein [Aquimarina muelleri]|uniref:ADP-ribosylglycohydrolase n=1 Tax=Aquimarina muelleri TaxID=279356 RepID=A0A918JRB7_9FLAO|nr:ADP-ribosylglycohydrolase family protein [Aquimarina muelleri]MCX2763431.1 ADP-ribosylglycohydrolase family protein [Aquimarina muelleri]GGX02763.1 hypothetical protein GCM10007384_00620 [Aquimarina muelleri]